MPTLTQMGLIFSPHLTVYLTGNPASREIYHILFNYAHTADQDEYTVIYLTSLLLMDLGLFLTCC